MGSESDVRHGQLLQAVARPMFWRLESCHLELASCGFRKWR